MKLSLVAALDRHRLIGADGGLPWRLPADLRRFKAITLGHPILMGRRTHESIGRALPGRRNIVLSRTPGYVAPGCEVAESVEAAIALCRGAEEVMVIGGAVLYAQTLPAAARLYLTFIDHAFSGDTHFPAFDPAEWTEVEREEHRPDEQNPYSYRFVIMERRPGSRCERRGR